MEHNNQNNTIKNSWSLLAFAKEFGKMNVGTFVNTDTGEEFKSCIFVHPEKGKTFVAFSSNLGELTPKQITARKEELQVIQIKETGKYKLCVDNSSWEEVNLD